ncbi:hypothetical protein B0H10DRAFT_2208983 [Mycena sp. CBHHK59/15]|nr:hypothetical protein B0H10DRAFT_2208983 [Mycena sp. CBHHK59/15]
MGDNTCVEKWINERAEASRSSSASQDFDDTDIDLLRVRCVEAETQRDDTLQDLHRMALELQKMEADRDQALMDQDQAVAKCDEWEEAAMSVSKLIPMAADVL